MPSTPPRETSATSEDTAPVADASAALRSARFGSLPARIPLARTVESQPSVPPNDPCFGRDPDNDWLVRYCA